MNQTLTVNDQTLGRTAGLSLLATIIVGILSAIFIAQGIDINLSADVSATASNMLEAESRLRAKAYLACFTFCLEALFVVCVFQLLRQYGVVLATWGLLISLTGSLVALLGAVYLMNAAEFASNIAYSGDANEAQRFMLTSLQATSNYTSFHLGLVLSALGNALFFYLFFRSGLIPKIIGGWGLFASLFVSSAVVARDFVPAIGSNAVTTAFMVSNLIALVSTGIYLSIRGVRTTEV